METQRCLRVYQSRFQSVKWTLIVSVELIRYFSGYRHTPSVRKPNLIAGTQTTKIFNLLCLFRVADSEACTRSENRVWQDNLPCSCDERMFSFSFMFSHGNSLPNSNLKTNMQEWVNWRVGFEAKTSFTITMNLLVAEKYPLVKKKSTRDAQIVFHFNI